MGAAAVAAVILGHSAPLSHAAAVGCSGGAATQAAVGRPTAAVAWRAGLDRPTAIYDRPTRGRRRAWVRSSEAPWLLVIGAARRSDGRCMVRVRLPERPNNAAGWIDSRHVLLAPTPWRAAVSRSHRTLSLTRSGPRVKRVRVVVGKPSTPTPSGLFAIANAVRGNPGDFTGSWILALTAHSEVLQASTAAMGPSASTVAAARA